MYEFKRRSGKKVMRESGIDLSADCWGDDLYDHLLPYLPDGFTLDDYETDGDAESVAVMGKTNEAGDFVFEFKAK